jgi:hypothetical protein
MELSRSVEVGSGGRIELFFPELLPGQKVDVHVIAPENGARMRPEFGRLKGLIKISDDFDEPIPGFEEYR